MKVITLLVQIFGEARDAPVDIRFCTMLICLLDLPTRIWYDLRSVFLSVRAAISACVSRLSHVSGRSWHRHLTKPWWRQRALQLLPLRHQRNSPPFTAVSWSMDALRDFWAHICRLASSFHDFEQKWSMVQRANVLQSEEKLFCISPKLKSWFRPAQKFQAAVLIA